MSDPEIKSPILVASIGKRANNSPSVNFWQQYLKIAPGHFFTGDILKVRSELLQQGICPKVVLSGTGEMKTLRYNDMTIHRLHRDSGVCRAFLEEYTKFRAHNLVYRGESMATFNSFVFDDMSVDIMFC